jgi:hypothetical protein
VWPGRGLPARRLVAVAGAGTLLWASCVTFAGTARAEPDHVPLCTVTDKRLTELSGLATDGQHWFAMPDGGSRVQVFQLGHDCAVQRVISAPDDPFDPEDLARAPDGTLWIADTGDNLRQRTTVALFALPAAGGAARLYRLSYPDGPHDAEALLLAPDGTPFVVTKEPLGSSGVYRPDAALTPAPAGDRAAAIPLRRVGSVRFGDTGTPGGPQGIGGFGAVLVTGGTVSADGTVAALRTYTDAYLYRVAGGDIAAALAGTPVRIPLPDEPQGEGIALEADGTLISGSERAQAGPQPLWAVHSATAALRRADGSAAPATGPTDGTPTAPAAAPARSPSSAVWPVTAVAAAGAGLAVLAMLVVRVAARRRRS